MVTDVVTLSLHHHYYYYNCYYYFYYYYYYYSYSYSYYNGHPANAPPMATSAGAQETSLSGVRQDLTKYVKRAF